MEFQLFEEYELPSFVSDYIIYNIHYLCIRIMYSEVLLSYSKKHVKKTLDLNTPFIIYSHKPNKNNTSQYDQYIPVTYMGD